MERRSGACRRSPAGPAAPGRNGGGDTIVVYTNIEANKAASWNDYYADGGVPANHVAWRGVTGASGGVLTLANAVTMDTLSLISFDHGLTAPHQSIPVEDDDETADVDERQFEGMFNGVPGTFACTDTTCNIQSDGEGNLSMLTGVWTFTADDAANRDGGGCRYGHRLHRLRLLGEYGRGGRRDHLHGSRLCPG